MENVNNPSSADETGTSVSIEETHAESPVLEVSADGVNAETPSVEAEEKTVQESQVIAPEVVAGEILPPEPETAEEPVAEISPEVAAEMAASEAARQLMADVLQDTDNLENVVAVAPPKELLMLLDAITHEKDLRHFVSICAQIKKTFQQHTDEGHPDVDLAMQGRFTTLWGKWNKRRAAYQAEMEEQKKENTKKKFELLEELRTIVDNDRVNEIGKVREIQTKWREVGWVNQADMMHLTQTFKALLDRYYKLRSMHHELIDLDRKHNLDEKNKLIAELKSITPAEDVDTPKEVWNTLTLRVRQIQDEWKHIGFVPKENAEELNENFRAAADQFFGLRSKFFEEEDKARQENETIKKGIMVRLTELTDKIPTTAKEWNNTTNSLFALQEEWKKTGPATFDENKKLWKAYRALCEKFFSEKQKFFKVFDNERTENLRLKTAITEEAEALAQSEEWSKAAARLKELQEEWKKIGAIHERHATRLWKRFRGACDQFFQRRHENHNAGSPEQNENLKAKEEVIAALKELLNETDSNTLTRTYRDLQQKLRNIGHVPYKVKDKVAAEYKAANDAFYTHLESLGIRMGKPNMESRINNITDNRERERKISNEMFKLQRALKEAEENVTTLKVNINFITRGKSGDALRNLTQGRIDAATADIEKLKAQIKELRRIENGEPPEEKPKKKAAPVAEPPAAEDTVAETPVSETPAVDTPVADTPSAEADAPAEEKAPE